MAAVLGILVLLFVLVGIPLLCRTAIRRMGTSQGLREWLNAYGPTRVGRDEPEDETDT